MVTSNLLTQQVRLVTLVTMLARSLYLTSASANPNTKVFRFQKPASAGFCLAINIAMISRINFGLGTPATRPQAPVGNPIGHLVPKTLPPPANHSLTVKTP